VRVKWRREQFSGITKYCRIDAGSYLLGIHRIAAEPAENKPTDPTVINLAGNVEAISTTHTKDVPKRHEGQPHIVPKAASKAETVPIVTGIQSTGRLKQKLDHSELVPNNVRVKSELQQPAISEGAGSRLEQPSPHKERTRMSTKWLDAALRRAKQESSNGKSNRVTTAEGNSSAKAPSSAEKNNGNSNGRGPMKSQGDLQPIEDVYRSAGIMNPRMGYSITKVVEMLNSDHIRGLDNDEKRAAVLMALDAAGVSIDEVLRDAKMRQDALNVYEADQLKHFEEHWARKDEVNAEIQTELDRLTAQYLERIKHNLDEVELEKSAYSRWQTLKQEESERISEAVGLCSKATPTETSSRAVLALREIGTGAKPS
jgi:hypothetical protein